MTEGDWSVVVGCEAVKVLKAWRGAAQLTYRTRALTNLDWPDLGELSCLGEGWGGGEITTSSASSLYHTLFHFHSRRVFLCLSLMGWE